MPNRSVITYKACGHQTRRGSAPVVSLEREGRCPKCEKARTMKKGVPGTPLTDDSGISFEQVHEAVMRSEKNREALAGKNVEAYGTGFHTTRVIAKNQNLTVVELAEYLPTTRVNGEPYRYALVREEGEKGNEEKGG